MEYKWFSYVPQRNGTPKRSAVGIFESLQRKDVNIWTICKSTIANLGKYNEGELVGAWFTFPIDFEEVEEKIGLNDEYEEYAIHDYELPFTVDEYTSIGELNRLWEMVSELPEELQSELSALLTHFSSIEELSEHQEDIIIHSDCDDMY